MQAAIKMWSGGVPLDQYKPGDHVCLKVAAGWRRKSKRVYYKPTKAEWLAFHAGETDIPPDEKPPKIVYLRGRERVWNQREGYEVLATTVKRQRGKNVEMVKIRRIAVPGLWHTFRVPGRWYLRERVPHEATFQIHGIGEYDLWTTLDPKTGQYKTTHPDGTVEEGVVKRRKKLAK